MAVGGCPAASLNVSKGSQEQQTQKQITTICWYSQPPEINATCLDQSSGLFFQSSSYAPYAGVPIEVNSYPQFGDPNATSMVADLNGDGKPDEIAVQHVGCSNYGTYARILMGNGDGTFTPTLDEFAFNANDSVPEYSDRLDGTPFSDLLEVDGSTSSMHVYKGSPAPAFQSELEESQIGGTSGCGWVFSKCPER